jgi:hypothetical protein
VLIALVIAARSSWLNNAGDIAAIIAAAILVLGLVFGWFRQVSHSLHVAGNKLWLGTDEDDRSYAIPGLDLINTAPIALSYEVAQFDTRIANHEVRDMADHERSYVAPQERTGWNGDREFVTADLFPIVVEVRYEIQYARKSRRLWWWRRSIKGSFEARVAAPESGRSMTVLAENLDGPPTDSRVPWTSKTIFGWRL